MTEFSNSRLSLFLAALLLAMAMLGFLDLYNDSPEVRSAAHVILELLLMLMSLGSAIFLWLGWRTANSSLNRVRQALSAHQAERDAWRNQAQGYLKGLGEAIATQLKEWGLTAAESETALFLLKGFSHKEIGNLTGKSERTVRQHSIAVYRKSALSGRAELSAFFLEDLLLPSEPKSEKGEQP